MSSHGSGQWRLDRLIEAMGEEPKEPKRARKVVIKFEEKELERLPITGKEQAWLTNIEVWTGDGWEYIDRVRLRDWMVRRVNLVGWGEPIECMVAFHKDLKGPCVTMVPAETGPLRRWPAANIDF